MAAEQMRAAQREVAARSAAASNAAARSAPAGAERAMAAPTSIVETRLLRGQVLSSGTQQPIPGAAVLVPGAAAAVVTDSGGRFALPVEPGDSTVVVRRIGYAPARLALAPGAELDPATVILEPDSLRLDEVTVAGVGEMSAQRATIEAWLSGQDVEPADARVAGIAGCWALVGGRVPGASEGVVLRLHASGEGGREWSPVGEDSLVVRLGAGELRLEREGERLTGISSLRAPAGAAGVPLEFTRVRCPGGS